MLEKTNTSTDMVSVLTFAFGAAVIIPSLIALTLSLIAVAVKFF